MGARITTRTVPRPFGCGLFCSVWSHRTSLDTRFVGGAHHYAHRAAAGRLSARFLIQVTGCVGGAHHYAHSTTAFAVVNYVRLNTRRRVGGAHHYAHSAAAVAVALLLISFSKGNVTLRIQ